MRKIILYFNILISCFFAVNFLQAQNKASYEFGNGLNFNLNDGAYQFKIGGMIQPSVSTEIVNGNKPDFFYNVKRTYVNISAVALKERLSFFVQTDFSLGSPLLDAWVAYNPINNLSITFGQKQSFANNREMLFMEDKLQFADRSLLSNAFSRTGREFGLFVSHKFNLNNFLILPQVAVTSGDGRNSFGIDSRDSDKGGLKYSGRLDLYPLGNFSKGNDSFIVDLAHEKTLKFVIGGAVSYNIGASNYVGEGHGDFQLYDSNGAPKYPDYRKFYGDVLLKFHGFSFLGEYDLASATSLENSYTVPSMSFPLNPTQISEYLAIGTAFNVQLGYVTKTGYALDVRYNGLIPEFSSNINSIIKNVNGYSIGFSKYFINNNVKLQTTFTSANNQNNQRNLLVNFLVQFVL